MTPSDRVCDGQQATRSLADREDEKAVQANICGADDSFSPGIGSPVVDARLLLTVPQVMAALGASRWGVYQAIWANELRTVAIGRGRRVPIDALADYVAHLRKETRDESDREEPEWRGHDLPTQGRPV